MILRRFGLLAWAVAYAVIFCYVYVNYIHETLPIFALVERPETEFWTSLLLAIVPLVFYSFPTTAGSVFAALIYPLYYVPSVLTIHYALDREYAEILSLQIGLAVTMCFIFVAAACPRASSVTMQIPAAYRNAIFVVTILLILTVAAAYRGHMQLVSFAQVYNLRYENNLIQKSVWINYFVMWLTYCFLPFALARGFVYKERSNLLLGVIGCAIIYASTAAKIAILTPFVFGAFYLFMRWKGDILNNLLIAITITSLLLILLVPDPDIYLIKPLFFERALVMQGWLTEQYYEFFSTHPLTYLGQIAVINHLTGMYPYAPRQLGEVFGISVPGQSINAGFWASEGIASFGIYGLYFAGLLLAGLTSMLNWVSRLLDRNFVGLWICSFAMALINAPMSTAMVSGGGFIILLMLVVFKVGPSSWNLRAEGLASDPSVH